MGKKLSPGDVLIKAGTKAGMAYLVDSGRIIVNLSREGINELIQAEAPLILGEEEVFGAGTAATTSIAVENSGVSELPVDKLKALLQKASPQAQMLIKGLAERVKAATAELKPLRQGEDSKPCPPDSTAKVFGVIFHAARCLGKKKGHLVEAQWAEFKDYAVDLMEETEYRMRQALNILAKLGYAELDWSAGTLQFTDMSQIEAFFEFYQNYHFKSGYAQLLKTNDKITAITEAVIKVSEPFTPDRMGMVHMPFKATIDKLKEMLGKTFEADHLFRLEQKGLMVKRISNDKGGVLSFWRAEFEQMLLNWKVLREVELWNEKGYVDMSDYVPGRAEANAKAAVAAANEELRRVKEKLADWKPLVLKGKVPTIRMEPPKPGELLCPTCLTPHGKKQTVCEVCDSELKTAA